MALVLKSDQVAVNDDIDWQYLTEYGPTDQATAAYINAIMANGFDPGQSAFDGIAAFVTEMKAAGIWAKIAEIMPLFGGDYAGVCRKLKGEWSGLDMAGINGDAIGLYEKVGDAYIGRNSIAWTAGVAPALKTGFQADKLGTKWGFAAYLDSDTVAVDANLTRSIMGASLNSGSSRQFEARLTYTTGHATVAAAIGHSSNVTTASAAASLDGVLRWSGSKATGTSTAVKIFDDGVSLLSTSNPNYDEANSWLRDVWLFAKNPFPGDTTSGGYNGKCRFAAFDDGSLDSDQVAAYSAAIADLMSAMGKTF